MSAIEHEGSGHRDERRALDDPTALLRRMRLIRAFDRALPDLYTQGLIRGSTHAALGQEAVAVGACAVLRPDDLITSTHRGHGHAIAKGVDIRAMMAEVFGRKTGSCKGRGGSMHVADFSVGILGANGIVGGGIGIAGGAALSSQLRATGQVVVCFFGEGAINQGVFHGVANMAGIWGLPVVFLCENNQFAMSARVSDMTAVSPLSLRAVAYGFPGVEVDGMDLDAVMAASASAVARARAGDGPTLLVATCYRFAGHFSGDVMRYRNAEEAEAWLERDPIVRYERRLLERGVIDEAAARRLSDECDEVIGDAVAFATSSPFPEAESVADHVLV